MTISRYKIIIPLWIVLLLLQACLPGRSDEIIKGRVVRVYDGDTVTLLTDSRKQIKIRLAQIDAPESDQAFGQASRQSLSGMVLNKRVSIAVETIDTNGRTVGTIYSDGLDVNREQVRLGMAWAYRQYLRDQSLLQLETQARKARVGLWSDANPMPPWVYRHGGRENVGQYRSPQSTQPRIHQADFSCGSKQFCNEMASCEEAKYYLTNCGLSHLDRDRDGMPCESLCVNGK
jgi:endonuclease YncB( thermonuclease family)